MSGSADRTFRPRNRPPHGRRSGAGAALAASFSASRAAGELDLPASRGCCAAAATPATAALQRRRRAREAAPCESARGRAGAAARGYRIYRGQSRTLEGGSLRARYRICWVPRRSFPGVGAPRLNYGLVIAAGSAHDRAGVLRGRVPCGGRGGGSGGRARPGHPPPCGGAAVPLPAVRPDLLAAAQPGAAPEGTRRVGPRGCLRVPRVRQGLQRQAQPRGAPAHAHRGAALSLPRVRPLLQSQAEPAHAPAYPQRREAAPVCAVRPLLPRVALPAQPPAHPRAHARAPPAPPRRFRGAAALLLPPLRQELRARGLAQDPSAQPRPRARGPGGPLRTRAMMRPGPAADCCFLPRTCVPDPWRWPWAAAPSLDGIPGEGQRWLGLLKVWAAARLRPPPCVPPSGPSGWLRTAASVSCHGSPSLAHPA
ncbi:uncharacterized protein LOC713120 isoform X1 [Macaca mulatta]|uniref:translation initiation factor IF-2-like isoform X1 n=1 Tax=Macaca mulatta TaxID=9544 RepID=UPI0010A25B3B|nr:translation initiation factor IF-2-like isoform X1 [Macaca mulatta]XP_028702284.1 translation initiation factor IF-2-like isoform X1 [Macaca mulatta]XP_028702285.1 translation initiation factor IF-2-like isoform X1 [Macaca mulatta]XP_028702286.1 translation initiation factor IF-2-like isoform X1 [Macaca mulatta]XP_028702287.1 translation initiation factor IF-2-like isoform X1 [Macaca mulatta]